MQRSDRLPAAIRPLAAALLAGLLGAVVAPAGEPVVDDFTLRQVAAGASLGDLVVIVKVTEVVEPKEDDGKAKEKEKEPAKEKDKEKEKDKDKEEKKDALAEDISEDLAFVTQMFGGMQPKMRTVTVEIEKVLKGKEDAKTIKFAAVTVQMGRQQDMLIIKEWYTMATHNYQRFSGRHWTPFTLAKDKKVLLFLKPIEKKDDKGRVVAGGWRMVVPPVEGAPDKAVTAVSDALRKITEWASPPKLTAEDEAAARKLIAELGNEAFSAREAATKALIAKGAAVKALVEAELKSSEDPEVKNRTQLILEGLRPEFLPVDQPEAGAGGAIGVFAQ